MMIIRRVASLRQPLLRGVQVRCQGSAALNNEAPSKSTQPKPIHHMQSATIASTPRCDASAMALKRDSGDYYFEEHSAALVSAFNVYDDMQESEKRVTATARDMNLIEAALAVQDESYDKILILMRHGEAKHNVFERQYAQKHGCSFEQANEDENYPVDPMLTGKGCGTMLNVSNRTATFFNKETGLLPDLFVVSPLRRAIQSALISFPHDAPLTSLSGTPWVCHPACMEQANGNKSEFVSSPELLEETFPGINYELFNQSLMRGDVYNSNEKVPLFESKIDLMNRTDAFLEWIKERDERVVVVSSHATWLQSLCAFSLQYEDSDSKNLEMFKKGEMRSVGIKFS
ncbi:phosphoglycerate mutase family protein [Skeletonema marinoi]|uniref:Phosphoglycerate mutase family protein n=1 Tax=Skeletonema marinoi TaxID=267567 RepID=A0AAD8XYZ4_9STRA|nr:phosphoglycerate mutase family protein [Skeletonema marinoi]